MKVLVDTSIWSLSLRRRVSQQEPYVVALQQLITDSQVVIIGAIRQEILSGIRFTEQFTKLRNHLRAFPNVSLDINDYELAAEFFNTCRSKGIQGSNIDFLICAVAVNHQFAIFTTDRDFSLFQEYLPIALHPIK